MPSTLIFGGSGKVAQHLTKLLTSATPPHTVYSIVRSSSHNQTLEAISPHVKPIVQSIEDASIDELAALLREKKPDVVVWAAGAGGKGDASRTETVDRDGAIKSMDAAAKAGVLRYVIVSANDVRDRSKAAPEWYNDSDKQASEKSWGAIPRYFAAKLAADTELVRGNEKRKLKYTIVRPGTLSDDAGKGTVSAGRVHLGEKISREDVAGVLAEVIKNDATAGLAFDILGGNTPIKEAVDGVAERKEDTFNGYF